MRRVLVVRLRSIGDTVLATPSLVALRRFLPDAEIDILLESWVASVLDGFEGVTVIPVGQGNASRLRTANFLRSRKYDVAFNLHGGTTSSMLTHASRATHRFGFSHYRYKHFYNHLYGGSPDFWHRTDLHSAEQQLALLGLAGVPVEDRPKSHLALTDGATETVQRRLAGSAIRDPHSAIALIHPTAAFTTKQWATGNFAKTADFLSEKGFHVVAVAAKHESQALEKLAYETKVPITTFDDLTLPEITALASKAKIFVGNDSGIAHIASAVNTPSVVIFGSSNRTHWCPWTDAPNEIVYNEFPCQPCPGDKCREFGEPRCILEIAPTAVFTALERLLSPTPR